jgi:AAA family ATP:ADP antiporter
VASDDKSALEKTLGVFADVRRGEGASSLLLMLNIFTLLTAYYLIKPVREALILSDAGAEIKSYAGAAQALLFVFIVPLYSALASRVSRVRLINGMTLFSISNLAIFYVLGHLGTPIGVPFFLWVGLFNVMLVAQVWSLANDIYTEEQGKRLFAVTGIGSSLGAIFGAQIASGLFEPLGPYLMMLLAAALLGICIVLTTLIHLREKRRTNGAKAGTSAADAPIGGTAGGFRLTFRYRYLLLIAIMVLLSNLVNTTGEYILGKAVKQAAETAVSTGGSSGLTE